MGPLISFIMDENITKVLLNGMPYAEFIGYYIWAFIGAMLLFWISVRKAINNDPVTPTKWSWAHIWKGVSKIPLTMVIMAVSIIFWNPQISNLLFEEPTELTLWSSFFIIGFGSEKIKDGIFGGSKGAYQTAAKITRKLKNGK